MNYSIVKDVVVLRQKSTNIASASEAQAIIDKLEKGLEGVPNGVGLAAIQLGIPKRVAVIKVSDKLKYKKIYLINTELESKEEEFIFLKEGCLSFPDIFINTKRYRHYIVNNQRIEDNELVNEKLSFYYEDGDCNSDGLLSIAVQHEVDHFNGDLIINSKEDQGITSKQVIRSDIKVGRNELCPCGSGKKYKKCCLNS